MSWRGCAKAEFKVMTHRWLMWGEEEPISARRGMLTEQVLGVAVVELCPVYGAALESAKSAMSTYW